MNRKRLMALISAVSLIVSHLFSAVKAQPILTSVDLPQAGTTYLRASAVPPFFPGDFEAAGENLTWDFSDLMSTAVNETEYFNMGSASLTTQFIFSAADHFTAFELPDLGLENPLPFSGATTYHQYGASSYRVIGLGITTDIFDLPVIYEDQEELLPLPLTYGATLEGSSAFSVDLPELLYYDTNQDIFIEVDAWGTLLLPGASYECLRVRRDFSALDSVNVAAAGAGLSIPREGTIFEWYAAGEGMPVLSIQVFADLPAIWQFKPQASDPNGIADREQAMLNIHPNPSVPGDALVLSTALDGPHHVAVRNAQGILVDDFQLDFRNGETLLETATWSAGVYFVMVDGIPPHRVLLR